MEFSMTFPWVWRLSGKLEIICARHTPLNFHIWISKGKGQSAVLQRGQLTCLKVKAIFHIWESMCFWRSRLVIWPPCLHSFYSHFDLKLGEVTPNLCWMLWQMYFYKIYSKSKWKNIWNAAEKHCLLWAWVRKLYLIVKVGYYPWMSLACASV